MHATGGGIQYTGTPKLNRCRLEGGQQWPPAGPEQVSGRTYASVHYTKHKRKASHTAHATT